MPLAGGNKIIGLAAALAASLLAPGAEAHGQLTEPLNRVDYEGRRTSWQHRAPVYTLTSGAVFGYPADSYRCHDFTPTAGAPETVLTAGESFEAKWTMEAGHPGDCYMYLSYDADKDKPENWFKFWALPGCGSPNGLNIPGAVTVNVPLPAEVPACDHCVLRWEWTAHQQVSNIEFYVTCADVRIQSSAPPARPSPMVAISGIEHLPADASEYRAVYAGEGPEERFLVGPAIASYAACSEGSPGCLGAGGGVSPSPEPTSASSASPTPSPTAAPSAAPTPTVAPTAAPAPTPTAAPTAAPTATPTSAPTAAPTAAPTSAPAPPPATCAGQWQNCQSTLCCSDASYTCYEQNDWYAQCLPTGSCPGGGWTCKVLGDGTGPAPAPAPAPAPTAPVCVNDWQQCGGNNWAGATACCNAGYTCHAWGEWHHQCIPAGNLAQVKRHTSFLSTHTHAALTPTLMQRGSDVCPGSSTIVEDQMPEDDVNQEDAEGLCF